MNQKNTDELKKSDEINQLLADKEKEIEKISKELLIMKEEINSQKELIETQRDVAVRQRDEIFLQKKEITSSITYAKRIQSALLTEDEVFRRHFADHFILYKPKDIVSGDFYWMQEYKDRIVVVAADSTGHGVPGAFMSLMGIVFLNEIVEGMGIVQPNRILNLMREKIVTSLGHKGRRDDPDDGMDIAVISIDHGNNLLQYSGAFNPVYIIRNEEIIELPPDRMPLGYEHFARDAAFSNHDFTIRANDSIYMFSDGYIDQFGWRNNKKLMTKNFKNLLLEIQTVPMKAQKLLLENNLNNWKGDLDQLDDILVLGLQI